MNEVEAVQALLEQHGLDVPSDELAALAQACAHQRASIDILYPAGIDPSVLPFAGVALSK